MSQFVLDREDFRGCPNDLGYHYIAVGAIFCVIYPIFGFRSPFEVAIELALPIFRFRCPFEIAIGLALRAIPID